MPANHKVSVGWQIVATFVPIANFWAFYRIRKLQKYVLYIVLPSIALSVMIVASIFGLPDQGFDFSNPYYTSKSGDYIMYRTENYDPVFIVGQVIGWGLQGFAIYLVIVWSRQHNRSFEALPAQG